MDQDKKNTALVKLKIDHNPKAPHYKALNSSDDMSFGVGVIGATLVYFTGVIFLHPANIILANIAAIGVALIFGGSSFTALEFLRKRRNKKRLARHEDRYLYQLAKSVEIYNAEVEKFNLLYPDKEIYSPTLKAKHTQDRRLLLQAGETLKRKIEEASLVSEALNSSSINVDALDSSLDALLKAERELLLSGDQKSKKLLPESADYHIALADLNRQYPTE